MIQEIFEPTAFMKAMGIDPMAFVRKAEKEAQKEEDDDFVKLKNEPEECPTCKFEQELREYIRGQKSNIIKRGVKSATFHCTATQPNATVTAIVNYWKNVRKWINPGYNIVIGVDFFTVLADFNTIVNGALNYNSKGLHFSYIGGIDEKGKAKNTMTDFQKWIFEVIAEELVAILPTIKIFGHNEVANKACPSYKVKDVYPNYWTGK